MRGLAKVSGVAALVGDFLAWWVEELRATFMSILEGLRLRGATRLALFIEAKRLMIRRSVQDPKSEALDVIVRDAAGRWPASSAEDPPLSGATLTAVLPSADVLVKELVLPAAAEKRLERVLAIQAVRELPLPLAQLHLDYEIVRRLRATKQIVVQLRAAKRTQIDELSAWARSVGARLDGACFSTPAGEVTGSFLSYPSWRSTQRLTPLERRLAVSAWVLLLLGAAVIGAQWWIERHRVDAELAKIKAHAGQVRVLWKEIEAQSTPATQLIQLMGLPDAATVLGALPDALPSDTWASQVDIRAVATAPIVVNMSAFAPAATRLLDELAGSPHFKHVHLVYAASDNFGSHGDRVQLSAEWSAAGQASTPAPVGGRRFP